ncbi:MAG: hypothetical protein K8S18_16775 [Desulfobacula sp.]|nr:hypothetical protein [Desulfobacula sp.]
MDRRTFLILMIIFQVMVVAGQHSRPFVRKVFLQAEEDKVAVKYDLKNTNPEKLYRVNLLFVDERFNFIKPDSVFEDIGEGIKGGNNKKILWDVRKDPKRLPGNYQPMFIIDGIYENGGRGGPSNALLSVPVPGLGDYFVSNVKKRKIKPWHITVSSLGFIGLGIIAGQNRIQEYVTSKYVYEDWEWDRVNETWTYVNEIRTDVTEGDVKYWLFPNDKEIFFGVGIGIWIADIIYVWAKGAQNKKIQNSKILKSITGNTSFYSGPQGSGFKYTINL